MSLKHMQWVWDHSRAKGNDRLVLLRIADSTNNDSGMCWLGVESIAKTCGVSTRTVMRCKQSLEELGEITINRNAGPKGTDLIEINTTIYDNLSGGQIVTGDNSGKEGVTNQVERGDNSVTRTQENPSLNPITHSPRGQEEIFGVPPPKQPSPEPKGFIAPTADEVERYMITIDTATAHMARDWAQDFVDYYELNNWKYGPRGVQMVKWKIAASRWVRKNLALGRHQHRNTNGGRQQSSYEQRSNFKTSSIVDVFEGNGL